MRIYNTILILLLTFELFGQNAKIHGFITDEKNRPIEIANVTIPYTSIGTITNSKGYYELLIPANRNIQIKYTYIGYNDHDTTFNLKVGQNLEVNISLSVNYNEIDEVIFRTDVNKGRNLTRIEVKDFGVLPSASGNIEQLLKTMSGVSTNNELSSQYSVRGGNFDENLVYVNDVQIYRPFLIRSGQQEGLSFVNPDMVRTLDFSAGGFEAIYGDKMSSVLDIQYRIPTKTKGSVSLSMIGGNAHFEGRSKNEKFTHISGFRYKTTKYVLNSLELKGDYEPTFLDFQTNLNYEAIDKKLNFSFLGNVSSNKYLLKPSTRETQFGTFQDVKSLLIYYEGQELDQFFSYTGAFTTTYQANDNTTFKLIASTFQTYEKESFDIYGQYSINDVDIRPGSKTYGDSLNNIGAAGFFDHARNYLRAQVYSVLLKGVHSYNGNKTDWGVQVQNEVVHDELNEWEMVDSAGYSIPYRDYDVSSLNRVNAINDLNTFRFNAYVQNTKTIEHKKNQWFFTYGVRGSYWNYNKQTVISPRLSIAFIPSSNKNLSIYGSWGYYYQPPFYKELRNKEGELNNNLLAQKSVHYIIGSDYVFSAWNRPFKFTSEVYYKKLDNLVPYKIDNLQIQYLGKNNSNGYATGVEFKISGEFVKEAQSWASVSIMNTKEDLEGDYYYPRYNDTLRNQQLNVRNYIGYIPRPTNQLVNVAIFFQDYIPNKPDYKFHLTFFYGSRLPTVNPQVERYDIIYKMKAYKRIDAGFSKSIKRLVNTDLFESVWVNFEVLNLFGFKNESSYTWIRTVSTNGNEPSQYGIPNFLTGRRINAKVTFKF